MKEIIDDIKASEAIDKAFSFSERYLHKALEIIKPLLVDRRSMRCKMSQSILENENFSVLSKK